MDTDFDVVWDNWPTVETDRLVLRPVTLDDAPDIYAAFSDPEVTRYIGFGTHESLVASRAWAQAMIDQFESRTLLRWGIEYRADRRLIGTGGFRQISAHNQSGELAYAIGRDYWGRGVVTEAVCAVIAFGFETMKLNRISAGCISENEASARVLRKCGLTFEGRLREEMRKNDRFYDVDCYAILRRDYKGKHG